MPELLFKVTAQAAGQRLDRFLADRTPVTRSQVRRHIELGAVLLNGRAAKPARLLVAGDQVAYEPPPPEPDTAEPEEIPLVILHEDDELIVVDKPAGLVTHPAAGHPDGTLVNALLHHCGPMSQVGGRKRPGIVHRLDKDTSGVMVASKTDAAHLSLAAQFKEHTVERRYLALTLGGPPQDQGTMDTWHGRHPHHRKRFSSRVERGRRAVTHYRVRERLAGLCLVEATLDTGRTHQVRVHFSDHGFPILGDPLYSRSPRDPRLRDIARELGRQALHAAVLGIDHPVTGERRVFSSPLPADMQQALTRLGHDQTWPP